MVNTDRIHTALMDLVDAARPAREARQLEQILKQSQSLHDKLQRIEELLTRNRIATSGSVDQPAQLEARFDSDWPVTSLSRDVINSQMRQQAMGDWNPGTTAFHSVEAFHHRAEMDRNPAHVEQLLLQRYVPNADDLVDAAESLHVGQVNTTTVFSRPMPRDHDQEEDEGQTMRFVFLAIGLLLMFTLLLGA